MTILCTIDLETREVSLPADQRIASYDHNVDVIRFQAEPIEDFSLDTSSIKIAAQGPSKARHDYAVDPSTVQIEEETGYITFDWPIPAGVTEMPIGTFKYGDRGQLIFAVCAEIISGSTVSKAWHSDDGIITVVAHLEPEAGGGEDPEEEATNAQKIGQLQTDVAVINTQVGALGNGSPAPVETVAEMTDESAVYLYTGSETGYTAGNWYFWNGSAWTSGGTYGGAVTDTTLSVQGVPPDSKVVGDTITALDTRATAVESDILELQDGGYVADQQKIAEKINNWLEEHPEATTTVQDGSLTLPKFKEGELPFVTPEQFGAIGNGVVDDTVAMASAFNSGFPVALIKGKEYYVTSIDVTRPLVVYGNGAKISTKCGNTTVRMIILRTSAENACFYDVNFYTTVGVTTQGAHGETINNRSKRTGISGFGLNKLCINNCTFDGFDEAIIGQTATEDTQFSDALDTLVVENTSIVNTLIGISRIYKNVWINNCNIEVDKNAQGGEHCIYLLSDVLKNAVIDSTVCDTSESLCGSAIQFYPAAGGQTANLVNGNYQVNNCILRGDGFISLAGGGTCKATGCSMKIINYNATRRMRQFACVPANGSVLYVDNCNVDLELTDVNQNVIFNSCRLHSEFTVPDRQFIKEAINCIFENIGIAIRGSEKIVNCVFSSPIGIAGNYYFSVTANASDAYIANCIFRSGGIAEALSYNTQGSCTVVNPISSLPIGINTSSITVVNKIDAL